MLLAGGDPSTAKTRIFAVPFWAATPAPLQNMSIGRDSFLHVFVRYVCAENTDQYWDNTCLQLSSIQGSGLDMAKALVDQSIKING